MTDYMTSHKNLMLKKLVHDKSHDLRNEDHTHLEPGADVGDVTIIVHHLDEPETVSLPAFVIVVVVGGGDFDRARTKVHVYEVVGYNRQSTLAERMDTELSHHVLGTKKSSPMKSHTFQAHGYLKFCRNNFPRTIFNPLDAMGSA